MTQLLIQGGRVVDPAAQRDEVIDLRIVDGVVAELGQFEAHEDERVVDAAGLVVTPGFVDLCVHLREPGFADIETIESGAQAALAGGFTAIAAMPDTDPPIDTEATVAYIRLKGEEARGARVYPVGALTQGRRGDELSEMAGMGRAGAVAFSDEDSCVQQTVVFSRGLRYSHMLSKPVLTRCEDDGMRGRGVAHPGLLADLLGLPAIAPGTEELMVGRNIYLARQEQLPLHLLHLSTAESIRLLTEAKAAGVPVTASVTPQHLLLSEEAIQGYGALQKFRPPLRRSQDRQALVAALADGTVTAVSSDHVPRGEGEKSDLEFIFAAAGAPGLETTFPVLYTSLVQEGQLELSRLVDSLSRAPAEILGVPGGSLQPGDPADVSCFDVETPWRIDASRFLSRSRMSPFDGWEVRGRTRHVIVGGELRLFEGELCR